MIKIRKMTQKNENQTQELEITSIHFGKNLLNLNTCKMNKKK